MEYKVPGSGSAESTSGGSDLIWRTNEQTKYAEWWDGTKWVQGDWSDEYQKWYTYYNGSMVLLVISYIRLENVWYCTVHIVYIHMKL
jgi:hypothetical protein